MSVSTAKADISRWLSEWFEQSGKTISPEQVLTSDVNYVDAGFLDSIQMIGFILDIENRFHIRLTSNIMMDPRFATLRGLTDIIADIGGRSS